MSWRQWRWIVFALVVAVSAVLVDAFLLPAPRSSRKAAPSSIDESVSLTPPLRPGSTFSEKMKVVQSNQRTSLSLTGSYTRSRTILLTIDFYEVASYVAEIPSGTTEQMLESIWRDDGTKAYVLRFLFSVP